MTKSIEIFNVFESFRNKSKILSNFSQTIEHNDKVAVFYYDNLEICACLLQIEPTIFDKTISIHITKFKDDLSYKTTKQLLELINFCNFRFRDYQLISRHTINQYSSLMMLLDLGADIIGINYENIPTTTVKYPSKVGLNKKKYIPNQYNSNKSINKNFYRWVGFEDDYIKTNSDKILNKEIMLSTKFDAVYLGPSRKLGFIFKYENKQLFILEKINSRSIYNQLVDIIKKYSVELVISSHCDEKLSATLSLLKMHKEYFDKDIGIFCFRMLK